MKGTSISKKINTKRGSYDNEQNSDRKERKKQNLTRLLKELIESVRIAGSVTLFSLKAAVTFFYQTQFEVG